MLNTLIISPEDKAKAKGAVIMLHGYGDEGQSYINMAPYLEQMLPTTLHNQLYWLAPNAPLGLVAHEGAEPIGYAWFPLEWAPDGSKFEYQPEDYNKSRDILVNYLQSVSKELNIPFDKIVLMGFSQGAMLTLHTAPQLDNALAGTIVLAGRVLDPKAITEAKQRPPLLLMHGNVDDVVDHGGSVAAEKLLRENGFNIHFETVENAGHDNLFSPETLMTIAGFISQQLS